MKMIKGHLSISRPSYSDGAEKISISLGDREASISVVNIEIGYKEFVQALTGLGHTACEFKAYLSDKIGKKMELKKLEFLMPKTTSWETRKKVAQQEANKVCPDGWEPDGYFSSQDSFFRKDGKEWARTTIRRWV